MLQRLVANWLRQQAQSAVMSALNPDIGEEKNTETEAPAPSSVVATCFFPSSGEAADSWTS